MKKKKLHTGIYSLYSIVYYVREIVTARFLTDNLKIPIAIVRQPIVPNCYPIYKLPLLGNQI